MKKDWRKQSPEAAKRARERERAAARLDPNRKAKRAASYQRNKLLWLDTSRRKKYGISNLDVTKLLDAQRHLCPITLQEVSITSCLDHCHKTKKVRAVLSKRANIMLGFIEKNPLEFRRALAYLKKHSSEIFSKN